MTYTLWRTQHTAELNPLNRSEPAIPWESRQPSLASSNHPEQADSPPVYLPALTFNFPSIFKRFNISSRFPLAALISDLTDNPWLCNLPEDFKAKTAGWLKVAAPSLLREFRFANP
ncbi:hypothetical protein BDN72DRAFT_906640 [Pluteus cervinus]|uniref:Uncharacterized protein n=1 Tax=Pluteus cervinus TaxID=181527 RepID=A0ACD2ZYK9_9AGAR|nr:hypothetical protein BDN72DRAFT_906640 [Pluteus cervinus]